jgi:RNAse (barnase) inhibitor barstar
VSEVGRQVWPRGGVRRVPGAGGPIAAELAERGWEVAVVPAARTDAALWDGLADALGLPAWFGRNLDAFDEVLADLARPTALVLAGWTVYATARPERWDRLLHLLSEHARRPGPALVVLLTD